MQAAKRDGLAYLVLDGTLIVTDRVRADRPYFSGKHRVHGLNVQVIASPDGTILWTSGAVPGSVHDLRERGYRAIGVDPAAPSEPGYQRTEFEHHQPTEPVDAIVACTSLHHVGDLDHVLDRAAAALTPRGVLIVIEWAYEKFDEATARWCFDRLPDTGEPGWLHSHRDRWLASDQPWHTYLNDWVQR